MKLKKVVTITQKEATGYKELEKEAEELGYAIHKYSIKKRRFLEVLFSKYIDQASDPKPYAIRGRAFILMANLRQ